jgi:allantoin racemase
VTQVKEYLEEAVRGQAKVTVIRVNRGPVSIETFFDESFAAPELTRIVSEMAGDYDAVVLNCFADPAIAALRELTEVPVAGAGESAMILASLLGHRFSVVSVMRNSGPWTEIQASRLGLGPRLAGAVGVDIPVLELVQHPEEAFRQIAKEAVAMVESLGSEAVVLGCTGMVPLRQAIQESVPVPVVEPLLSAVMLACALSTCVLRP